MSKRSNWVLTERNLYSKDNFSWNRNMSTVKSNDWQSLPDSGLASCFVLVALAQCWKMVSDPESLQFRMSALRLGGRERWRKSIGFNSSLGIWVNIQHVKEHCYAVGTRHYGKRGQHREEEDTIMMSRSSETISKRVTAGTGSTQMVFGDSCEDLL